MNLWETILFAFGGPAVLLVLLGVLGKSFLDKLIARDGAMFAAQLQSRYTSEVERIRS